MPVHYPRCKCNIHTSPPQRHQRDATACKKVGDGDLEESPVSLEDPWSARYARMTDPIFIYDMLQIAIGILFLAVALGALSIWSLAHGYRYKEEEETLVERPRQDKTPRL